MRALQEPPLNPMTKEPVKPEDVLPIFPMEIIRQEVSTERWIPIPEEVREEVIFFNNSGHGHFDLGAYDAFLQGKLVDYEYPVELVKQALANLPKIP